MCVCVCVCVCVYVCYEMIEKERARGSDRQRKLIKNVLSLRISNLIQRNSFIKMTSTL